MQLVTSDLDRTLIFSKRTIAKESLDTVCIEMLDEREISFVTRDIQQLLQKVNEKMEFVPVTTRSIEQYNRITLFQKEIVPKTAVVANGGIILRHGKIDKAWQLHIEKMIAQMPVSLHELQHVFSQQLAAPYFLNRRIIDHLFVVYKVDLAIANLVEIEELKLELALYGWDSYLQGRKFYIIPMLLTKGAAVHYLKEQYTYEVHAAAGDSLMDLSMLYLADHSFTPMHGEIMQFPDKYRSIKIVQKTGAEFSEYFLRHILAND